MSNVKGEIIGVYFNESEAEFLTKFREDCEHAKMSPSEFIKLILRDRQEVMDNPESSFSRFQSIRQKH